MPGTRRARRYTVRDVRFPGALGADLAGSLEMPADPPRAYAVFAHCFTCDSRSHAATRVSTGLADRGYAVLRFDSSGLGASGGDFADATFTSHVDDIVAAGAWLAAEHAAPSLLVGHSLGGAAVIAAAHRLDSVTAVATIAAPAHPGSVTRHVGDATPDADGRLDVTLAGRPIQLGAAFLTDVADQPHADRIGGLARPLLILHSPIDDVVDIRDAGAIFRAARHPVSFVALDGADHLLSRRDDAHYAAAIIATWASRYTPEPPAP